MCVGSRPDFGSAKKYLKSAKLVHVSTAHYDHLFGRAIRQMKALTLNFKTAQTDFQSPIKFALKILKNIFSTFYENTRNVVTSRHDHLFLRSIQEMKALTLNFKMTQTGFQSPIKCLLKILKDVLSTPVLRAVSALPKHRIRDQFRHFPPGKKHRVLSWGHGNNIPSARDAKFASKVHQKAILRPSKAFSKHKMVP